MTSVGPEHPTDLREQSKGQGNCHLQEIGESPSQGQRGCPGHDIGNGECPKKPVAWDAMQIW